MDKAVGQVQTRTRRLWHVDAHILAFLSVSTFIKQVCHWCYLQRYHTASFE
jgi:hypothetical protein